MISPVKLSAYSSSVKNYNKTNIAFKGEQDIKETEKSYLFRFHRGSLSQSMDTLVGINSKKELCDIINKNFEGYEGISFDVDDIEIKPYGYDERIGWDTHIVLLHNYGVIGFANGQLEENVK